MKTLIICFTTMCSLQAFAVLMIGPGNRNFPSPSPTPEVLAIRELKGFKLTPEQTHYLKKHKIAFSTVGTISIVDSRVMKQYEIYKEEQHSRFQVAVILLGLSIVFFVFMGIAYFRQKPVNYKKNKSLKK